MTSRSETRRTVHLLLMLPLLCAWVTRAEAGPGALDPSFGSGGKVTTILGNHNLGHAMAIDSQNRVVVVGASDIFHSSTEFDYDFVVLRYNPDGTLDKTFGGFGFVTTDISGSGSYDWASAVAIDGNGKIVVAGFTGPVNTICGQLCLGGARDVAVVRYNPDGSLDTGFGGTGIVTTNFGGTTDTDDYASAVAVDGNGRIVVAGGSQTAAGLLDFALARYNSDGTLDAGFGTGGLVTTDFSGSGSSDTANAVAIDGNGKIVAAGSSNASGSSDFALARYDTNGSLDAAFGTGGLVKTDFNGSGSFDAAKAVAIDGSGDIVAAGDSQATGSDDFALARYTASGVLDTTFGTGGLTTTDFSGSGSSDVANGLTIDGTGRPVAAGSSAGNFALARYGADGRLDGGFGTGGLVTTDLGSNSDAAAGVGIDSDGRIVAAGAESSTAYAVARYLTAIADLSITKTATPNPVLAGQALTYTIVVTNNGPDGTPFATLTDALPANLTYQSAATSAGTCAQSNGTVTCDLGALAASATATITIQVAPTEAAASSGSVSNTASVAGSDPTLSNNSATIATTVSPAADLSVTKTGSPNPVTGGSNITYTIVVSNLGPSPATQVSLTDPLTDTFVSFAASAGVNCGVAKAKGNSTLTCAVGSLDVGASGTVAVVVKSAHKKGTTRNTASATAHEADPNTANNTATAVVSIQ